MFIELLRNRRSIRRFAETPVSKDQLDILIEAALRSPSGKGINPWEFIVVEDKECIEKLSQAREHGSAFLKNAPLVIVVCADTTKTDVWTEDASIAAINIQLAAEDIGLGSCWAQMRGREHQDGRTSTAYIAEILGLPENIQVQCIIGIGQPAERKEGHATDKLLFNQVSYEQFGKR